MHTKRLVLIGGVIVTAILAWWTTYAWLSAAGHFADWRVFVWPLVLVIVYAAVASLALTLLESRWDRLAVITSSWAAFVLFFPASIWYLSALPVFFLFWMYASRRNQRELDERHVLRIRSIAGAGARLLLLGIFLMISLGFYSLRSQDPALLDAVSESILNSVDRTYDSSFVQEQLADLGPGTQAQVRSQIAGYVGSFVNRWLAPLGQFLPPLFALALFILLWGFIWLIREPVLWLTHGLFAIMRRTGFVSVAEKQVPKEVVSL